ncbi:Cytidine deaminase [Mycena chlorophos]|uniref:Cytidine deaminase n=1 Tax=Mycena chlorophos TaxID=658473 RepID=A0A8H6S4W0_MYCCL|nr:Cytidine deaminase [Mycena chlorophos]
MSSASARVWTLSIEQRDKLVNAAFEAKEHSYSPYSKFPRRCGAARGGRDGVQRREYRERVVWWDDMRGTYGTGESGRASLRLLAFLRDLAHLVQSDGTKSFIALAVTTNVASAISPCGFCRQFIREFCAQDMPIFLIPGDYNTTKEGIKETSIGELLPDSFGPEQLELPRDAGKQ